MISLVDAQRIVVDSCPPLAPVEAAIEDSVGLVLAAEVAASEDVPPFANSAVDGYAYPANLSTLLSANSDGLWRFTPICPGLPASGAWIRSATCYLLVKPR